MIDVPDKDKAKWHRFFLQTMERLETSLHRRLKPIINAQYIESARLFQHGINDVGHAVVVQRPRLKRLFRSHYKQVGNIFNTMAFKLSENQFKQALSYDKKGFREDFERTYNAFIAAKTRDILIKTDRTTQLAILKVIQNGQAEGLAPGAIATKIRKVGNITSSFRARRISRTETHAASQEAFDTAVSNKAIPMDREWVTFRDGRERTAHRIANGQIQPQDTPFDVGGEHLRFPGDQLNGSAKNVVNCRCVLFYKARQPEQQVINELPE